MRIIGTTLIIIGFIFGLLGIRSYWRDDTYEKASTVVKASVKSVEIKPMSGKAVGSIRMVLNYMRDGIADSIEHNFSAAYSNKDPLPTVKQLHTTPFYVRYVPKGKRSETIPNWVIVSNNGEFDGSYGLSSFGQMLTFILMGFMVRMFGLPHSAPGHLSTPAVHKGNGPKSPLLRI